MKQRRGFKIPDAPEPAMRRIPTGKHRHVAEIHGENATLGLRPWARRAVLGHRG